MSSPHSQAPLTGGYDQSLLAAAPVATKAAKQEGYNVDLLDEGRHHSTSHAHQTDLEAPRGPKENHNLPVGVAAAPSRKVPFWRTRRGIIGLAVVAVVIVGAVVGGAVGGSVGKKNGTEAFPANSTASAAPNSTTPEQGQQGVDTVTPSASQGQASATDALDPNPAKESAAKASDPTSTPTDTAVSRLVISFPTLPPGSGSQ